MAPCKWAPYGIYRLSIPAGVRQPPGERAFRTPSPDLLGLCRFALATLAAHQLPVQSLMHWAALRRHAGGGGGADEGAPFAHLQRSRPGCHTPAEPPAAMRPACISTASCIPGKSALGNLRLCGASCLCGRGVAPGNQTGLSCQARPQIQLPRRVGRLLCVII